MKCPKCGAEGSLSLYQYFQYSKNYNLNKAGRISLRGTKEGEESLYVYSLYCEKCNTMWSSEERPSFSFSTDSDGREYIVIDEELYEKYAK